MANKFVINIIKYLFNRNHIVSTLPATKN